MIRSLLFSMQAEPLVTYIIRDPNFKGVDVKDENWDEMLSVCWWHCFLNWQSKLSGLVDKVIEEFGKASSGSKLNIKTIGLSTQTRDNGEELNMKFTNDSERLLGIPFGFEWMEMNIGSDWLKNEFKDSTSEK